MTSTRPHSSIVADQALEQISVVTKGIIGNDAGELNPTEVIDLVDPPPLVAPPLGTMGDLTLIVGSPGAGKTEAVTRTAISEHKGGTLYSEIAVVTFGVAAAQEAKARVLGHSPHCTKADLEYWGTIHSQAWKSAERPGEVLGPSNLRDFEQRYGYRIGKTSLSDEHGVLLHGRPGNSTEGVAALLDVLGWIRAKRLSLEEGHRRCPVRVDLPRLKMFLKRLNEFKGSEFLFDFADLLDLPLMLDTSLDHLQVAIIDEAQDLSLQQIATITTLFRNVPRIYVAGDDDQHLHGWAGAHAGWLSELEKRATDVVKLTRSYRVPRAVHKVATKIITSNRWRIRKSYSPKADSDGVVSRMNQTEALNHVSTTRESVLVLARNSHFLKSWQTELLNRNVPITVEGPVGEKLQDAYRVVNTALLVRNRRCVVAEELCGALDCVHVNGASLFKPAAMKRISEDIRAFCAESGTDEIEPEDLTSLGLERWQKEILDNGVHVVLPSIPGPYRSYLKKLSAKYPLGLPKPKITLTTIHRAKGREAHTVVVIPKMQRASWAEYVHGGQVGFEAENRLAYVALTRASEHLILLEPKGKKCFPYHLYLS